MPNSNKKIRDLAIFYFDDATYSSGFLNFNPQESSKLSDEILTNKIKQLYGSDIITPPHYYTDSLIPSEFNKFAASDQGKAQIILIQSELKICFEKLSAWAMNQKLEVVKPEWDEEQEENCEKLLG